jgi:DNA helicase-2/ATP-dependent DNA helicase PcrA
MTPGIEVLEGLNPAQREAVETTNGPLLIVAGPGSGKTRVITHRIAYLVRVRGVSPYRIAAVTFTNKAAREMRDRLQRLIGTGANSLTVGTFHAFCALLLRREGGFIGLDPNYSIYDADDQLAMIKKAMELAELDPKRNHPRAVLSVISRAKSVLLDSQGLARQAQFNENHFEELCARVYHHYEELLARNRAVDFDDLLLKAVQLLQERAEVREKYQSRYLYLMIDEFQDTNIAQYQLARLLTGEQENICVVGDPDQSIYSWRNADIRNILSFQRDYPNARTIALEQNYRSTVTILETAKHLISVNGMRLHKDLFTDNEQGVLVTVHEAYDEEEEAEFVVSEVGRLARQEKVRPGDCAIMYRTNAQSRALEEACLHLGMKYKLVGALRFYQRREIKDLMAYLRLLHNPQDEVNLGRVVNVPPRGIGAKTMQDLVRWSQSQNISLYAAMQRIAAARASGGPCPAPLAGRAANVIASFATMIDNLIEQSQRLKIVDLIDRVLEDTGLHHHIQNSDDRPEERWENIMELRETAYEFNAEEPPNGLSALLERLSLVADVDHYEEAEDSITLITLHQAKGLEFPVVFIVGLEEGLLPHSRSMESEEQLEEERRLCYVGITRAQQRLYLLRAFRRSFQGSSGPTLVSRFLREIPAHLITSAALRPNPHPFGYAQDRPDLPPSQGGRDLVLSPLGRGRVREGVLGDGPEVRAAPPLARTALSPGNLVRHTTFGEGVVISCIPSSGDHEVTVEFSGGAGIKRLLLSYAPLEKIQE